MRVKVSSLVSSFAIDLEFRTMGTRTQYLFHPPSRCGSEALHPSRELLNILSVQRSAHRGSTIVFYFGTHPLISLVDTVFSLFLFGLFVESGCEDVKLRGEGLRLASNMQVVLYIDIWIRTGRFGDRVYAGKDRNHPLDWCGYIWILDLPPHVANNPNADSRNLLLITAIYRFPCISSRLTGYLWINWVFLCPKMRLVRVESKNLI
ncbi:hypothetical protein KQX54_021408 [Cotesia glomerata]|uniref:Uncharacterized protein n=1 Tax=Cotesia glomerata TaxID=32391 RepID=A0AAV7J9L8_COTGL|nr:hypothetical protein KQX54_021408 [Cotesia glomerata]